MHQVKRILVMGTVSIYSPKDKASIVRCTVALLQVSLQDHFLGRLIMCMMYSTVGLGGVSARTTGVPTDNSNQ